MLTIIMFQDFLCISHQKTAEICFGTFNFQQKCQLHSNECHAQHFFAPSQLSFPHVLADSRSEVYSM